MKRIIVMAALCGALVATAVAADRPERQDQSDARCTHDLSAELAIVKQERDHWRTVATTLALLLRDEPPQLPADAAVEGFQPN